MFSATLWVFLAVAGLIYYLMKPKKETVNLPGPKGWPFLGSMLDMEPSVWPTFDKYSAKYGPLCKVMMGPKPMVLVSDNKIAKEMLAMDAFAGRVTVDEFNLFEGGENLGLLNSEEEVWEEQRRFTVRQLRDLGFGKSSMESMILEEVKELQERIVAFDKKPVGDFKGVVGLALINSLWHIVAGTRFSQDDPKLRQLLYQLSGAFDEAATKGALLTLVKQVKYIIPEYSGYNHIRRAMASAVEFVTSAIQEHKATIQHESPRDFIDVYLSEIKKTSNPASSFHGSIGEKHLTVVISDLFQAGTETTTVTLDWAILHLMKQPEIQKKLQAEITAITGDTRQVNLSDRPNMPYALAFISELLRIAIAPFGAPHRALRDVEYKGVLYPKGTEIFINMHYMHHDPKIWDRPNDFWPERFLSEDGKSVKKVEHLNPFLVGRRQCPGESLARDSTFLFTTNIVQKFDILPDPNSPEATLEPDVAFTKRPKPYKVIFQERKK